MTDQERALYTIAKAMGLDITINKTTPKTTPIEDEFNKNAMDIFNNLTGGKFRSTTATTKPLLLAIRKAGYTLDDISRVVEHKVLEWKYDASMKRFLVPSTLLRFNNFEKYLEATTVKVKCSMYEILKGDWE